MLENKRKLGDHIKSSFTFRLLEVFAKFRKATINFVMSVCPPIRPQGTPRRIFVEFGIFVFFLKSVEEIQFSLKPDKNEGHWASRPTY
jgi:hypothetical protein